METWFDRTCGPVGQLTGSWGAELKINTQKLIDSSQGWNQDTEVGGQAGRQGWIYIEKGRDRQADSLRDTWTDIERKREF